MTQLHANFRGRIPSDVLKGRRPSYKSVHTVFINVCTQEYLKRLYESYWERSHLDASPDTTGDTPIHGRPDDQGNTWEQLRPSTYEIKQDLYDNTSVLGSYVRNRRSIVARQTYARVKGIAQPVSGDGINIRTGQLLAACYPAPIINGRLASTKDQNIQPKGLGIHFDTHSVPHSKLVEASKRPITPNDETAMIWMQEAIDIAIDAAAVEYQRIRSRMRERSRRRRQVKR